ncbi:MAG: family ATPase [Proteobacteria bacterium]|nr:family ATPase [Pseudomonadota bacterium]
MTKFSYLKIEGWRQFGHVEIELHPRLTILTGANGAGKSSILRIFTRHFGFDRPFLATPVRNESGGYSYLTGLFTGVVATLWRRFWTGKPDTSNVGTIRYDNKSEGQIQVPIRTDVQYSIGITNQQSVPGIHIDSHSSVSVFQQVGQIPTTIINAATAFNNYNGEILNIYQGGHTGYSPIYRMKEAIIAMAMFGEGNTHVLGNKEVLSAYQGYVDALRKMLPESLGFIDLSVRPPEVVLVTKSGEFLIDASSGGVMTIIDLTWRLHMFSLLHEEFVVTIDEPENHLHPTMQRSLLRRLLTTFPQAQFIIATHSPFMVSSVRDSNVFILRYISTETGELESGEKVMPTETSRVVSLKLDTINKAGNASEILREVLGVPATIPEWVEEGLADVVARYRNRQITSETLLEIRRELSQLGYDDLYPDALAALTRGQ